MAEIYGYIWFSIQWLCSAVSGYFIFKKAGQEGWKSLVPLCGGAICYLLVWEPGYYFVYVILAALFFVFPQIIIFGIAAGIRRFIFSYKLAGCFGRGIQDFSCGRAVGISSERRRVDNAGRAEKLRNSAC